MIKKKYPISFIVITFLRLFFVTQIPPTISANQDNLDTKKSDRVFYMDISDRYVISLVSTLIPLERSALPSLDIFNKYQLYPTRRSAKNGKIWHRWRLGFFPTKKAALRLLESLRNTFPDGWVTKISRKERALAMQLAIESTTSLYSAPESPDNREHPAADVKKKSPMPARIQKSEKTEQLFPKQHLGKKRTSPSISEEELYGIMEEADKAITGGNYQRAVQLYTKILLYPDHKYRQTAQEFLGLARERKGQLAHARAEYEKYLSLYPKGEGAERVQQRLAGILTARAKPKGKLRKAKMSEDDGKWKKDFYGSFSQYYYLDMSYDLYGETTNQSALPSDMDVNARIRNADYDISTEFIGDYEKDFLDDGDSESRIRSLYLDAFDLRRNISGRIGRQSLSSSGVFGRFDGTIFGYRHTPQINFNGVAGFPVDSTKSKEIKKEQPFYGISLDMGTFRESWDFNTFAINQDVDGITDRRAVGGEVRYFNPQTSVFSLIDYDISYHALNAFLATGHWVFPDRTTLNISLDYRKSPILTTSNALRDQNAYEGQNAESISDLLNTLSEHEVRDRARDKTGFTQSFSVSVSHPINKKYQLSGDLNLTKSTYTPTGYNIFFSSQLIGSSLIKEGDIAILGFRYTSNSASDTFSAKLNTRYPISREWRLNPRLRYDFRRRKRNDGIQSTIKPSFRMNYYWKRRVRFEFEIGGEWIEDSDDISYMDGRGLFLLLGYRVDF